MSRHPLSAAFSCCLLILAAVLPLRAASSADAPTSGRIVWVAADGDDRAPGTSGAPVATLTRARDLVRQSRKTSTPPQAAMIRVTGDLAITEPLVLTPEDSGTADCPVIYEAGDDATISGGRKLTGWKRWEDDIWTIELPEVAAGKWNFRQLFVNGRKQTRARIPNEGFLRVAGFPDGGREIHYHTDCKRFEYFEGDLDPAWKNLQDVEVIVYHFWTDSHLPIESIDAESRIVTFQHKAGKVFTDDFTAGGARYIVENVFEGLDRPGEWYLDRKAGRIYLMVENGQDPNGMHVVAPVARALIRFEGDPRNRRYVEHIAFRNLTFEYTNFVLPRGNSNDRQGSASVTAAVQMKGARDCAFIGCAFRNLGTWACELAEGCSGIRFAKNELNHIGAGAFRIDGGSAGSHPLLRTHKNEIVDNRILHYGDEFPSAVGVLLQNTSGNTVAHNEIAYGYYTGVSAGWVWGYQRSIARDNLITHNHIHHIGQGLLADMGGIYTLGVSPGTVIRNNLIHDVEANHYGGWGIYNDEGSSHILIENNIVFRTKFAGYNIHFAKEITVRNNIFALGRIDQLSRGRVEPHKSCFFENNIVFWEEGELLSKRWNDKPYPFHFHPKNAGGTREETSTFDMDYNVYWNPHRKLEDVSFNGMTWSEWQEAGKDRHSVYADPRFVDPARDDFRLKADSPAFALGFKPIDISTVGPREDVGPHDE